MIQITGPLWHECVILRPSVTLGWGHSACSRLEFPNLVFEPTLTYVLGSLVCIPGNREELSSCNWTLSLFDQTVSLP